MKPKTLAEVTRAYILKVLHSTGGHQTNAARILGITPKTVYNKLKRWKGKGR